MFGADVRMGISYTLDLVSMCCVIVRSPVSYTHLTLPTIYSV